MPPDRDEALLAVRVPRELRRRFKAATAALDTSMEAVIVQLIERWLEENEKGGNNRVNPQEA